MTNHIRIAKYEFIFCRGPRSLIREDLPRFESVFGREILAIYCVRLLLLTEEKSIKQVCKYSADKVECFSI